MKAIAIAFVFWLVTVYIFITNTASTKIHKYIYQWRMKATLVDTFTQNVCSAQSTASPIWKSPLICSMVAKQRSFSERTLHSTWSKKLFCLQSTFYLSFGNIDIYSAFGSSILILNLSCLFLQHFENSIIRRNGCVFPEIWLLLKKRPPIKVLTMLAASYNLCGQERHFTASPERLALPE
jgi:hypothetical protein